MRTATALERWAALAALFLWCGSLGRCADPAPAGPPPKAKVAFLGVSVQSALPAEAKDLGLAEGVGLVVRAVEEQSPAQGRISVGDILTRLDDQILIQPYQLAVLVRTYKPGTEVRVALQRGGNAMDVAVVLGEREAVPLPSGGGGQAFGMAGAGGGGVPPLPAPLTMIAVPGGDQAATVVSVSVSNNSQRTATTIENGTAYALATTNGVSTFTVTGADAKVLFTGPVSTAEEKARVPEAYRARLAALEAPPPPGVAP